MSLCTSSPVRPALAADLAPAPDDLDGRVALNLRMLAADAVEAARSGHPGLPMGAATAAWVLWSRHLRFDPTAPHWPDRDRFVLSAGHGSMLLYALVHLSGYDLPLSELQRFRQWGSATPGHPEFGHTPGVETTTGPLGQGIATAVGMALAERMAAARYHVPGEDSVVDHRTFVLCSDGDLMEGVSGEAASLAGHLGLGRLVVLYDDNGITIDGGTDLAFTEDVPARFTAYGWHVTGSTTVRTWAPWRRPWPRRWQRSTARASSPCGPRSATAPPPRRAPPPPTGRLWGPRSWPPPRPAHPGVPVVERPRPGPLRRPLPGGRPGAHRRARGAHGRRTSPRALRRGDRGDPAGRVRRSG